MTGVTVAPASTIAADTGLVAIAFTNAITIPVGGKITIQFPTGFQLAPTELTLPNGINSASTISASGTILTLTMVGSALSAGATSFTVNGITNPGLYKV